MPIDPSEQYASNGWTVVRALFSRQECRRLIQHYMALREAGVYPGDFDGVDLTAADPLKRYPRMIHMHRWDPVSLQWLLDARLNQWLTTLLGEEPLAVQTMLYFKPPGARGQALHQDQFYLRVQPGTCMAAWLALDDAGEENGCMQCVPGTAALPILCTERADTTRSFTDVTVPLPPGMDPTPIRMRAGDVLFFNGSVVHGSYPNTSDRFRRALIGHYISGSAERVGGFYHPILHMDGTEVTLAQSPGSARCGVWAEREDGPHVEMREAAPATAAHE